MTTGGFHEGPIAATKKRRCDDTMASVFTHEDGLATLTWDDLELGELLGSGSFSSVYRVNFRNLGMEMTAIRRTTVPYSRDNRIDELESENGSDSSDVTIFDSTGRLTPPPSYIDSSRFALKRLSEASLLSSGEEKAATEGMRFEAELLSRLLPPHANIIRMYGISSDFYDKPEGGFIILEYLSETLDERLKKWRNRKWIEQNNLTGWEKCQRIFDRRRGAGPEQRFRIAHIGVGVAEGMKFMHKHGVLYRDLKPSNIGFDDNGQVRLFDFDLSRLYKLEDKDRKITKCVGSLRYMSPECASGHCYGFPSDVHSFAILLWEICTLQRPFSGTRNSEQLTKKVFIGNHRPPLRPVAAKDIKLLLRSCWEPNPSLRPSFAPVVDLLRSHTQKTGAKKRRDK